MVRMILGMTTLHEIPPKERLRKYAICLVVACALTGTAYILHISIYCTVVDSTWGQTQRRFGPKRCPLPKGAVSSRTGCQSRPPRLLE